MISSNDFEPIKPADIPLTQTKPQSAAPLPWQQRPTTYVALAASILLALAVIFVLPALIKPPETPPVVIAPQATVTQAAKETPFRDAQLAKARRESQDTLSTLLEKQSFLEKKNVQGWAKPEFQEALTNASEGDLLYRQRQFAEAQTAYQAALTQLTALEARIPDELSQALSQGDAAFKQGNDIEARQHYQLALSIEPGNSAATSGIARTTTLDKVLPLVTAGNNALEEQQLDQARELFNQALALDALHPEAKLGLQQTSDLIQQRDFNLAMSRGYQALEQQQYTTAAKAFREALAIIPGHSAANTGLAQANNAASQRTMNSQLNRGASHEDNERWHQASEVYGQILARDGSVVEAKLGQIRSTARAKLSDDIDKILAQPLRLSSANVLNHAQQLLRDAEGIASPGPKHRAQTAQLKTVLQQAVVPVPIELQSDNNTQVTLFKVGELGVFSFKQLQLKPGNYVAVGSRAGYRDVRVEFKVTPSGLNAPVVITCREPIS